MEQQNQQPQPPVFNQPQAPQQAPQYQPRVEASPMMDPVVAVKTCLKKYFDFKGRARRSEYWWFVLFTVIVSSVFSFLGGFLPVFTFIGLVCSLLLLIPQLAALTRRLHDTNRSGWWIVLMVIAMIGIYGSLCVMLMPYADKLMAEGDNMALAKIMADAVGSNAIASTTMICSGLAYLFFFVITFIFSVIDSKWGENKYGPSPKYQ